MAALLTAYFDESGTSLDSRTLVVAGYVAPITEWNEFQAAWQETLSNAGIDPTKIAFHMAEFESRHKEHMRDRSHFLSVVQRWTDSKAAAVLAGLLGIMRERITFGVAIAVQVEDYEQWCSETGSTLNRYAFCATRCLHRIAATMDEHHVAGDIAYVFEEGAEGSDQINAAVAGVLADKEWRREYRMHSLAFGKKLEYLQLQAADILVWETRRYCLTARSRTGVAMRASLEALVNGLPHYSEYYDKLGLDSYLREFAEHHAKESSANEASS